MVLCEAPALAPPRAEATPTQQPSPHDSAKTPDSPQASPHRGVEYTCCEQVTMCFASTHGCLDSCTSRVAASRRGIAALTLFVACACVCLVAYSVVFMLPFNFHGDCGFCGEALEGKVTDCDASVWGEPTCAVMYALGGQQDVSSTGTCTNAQGESEACACSCHTACEQLDTTLAPLRIKVSTRFIDGGDTFHIGCPMPPTTNSLRIGGASVAALWLLGMTIAVLCLPARRSVWLAATSSVLSGIAMLFLFGMGLDAQAVAQSQAACDASFDEHPWPLRRNNLYLFGVDRRSIDCALMPFAWLPVMDIALAGLLAWLSAVYVTRYKLQSLKASAQASASLEAAEVPDWSESAAAPGSAAASDAAQV